MRLTFNYGVRDIFGMVRDISSDITATVERVDKVFAYMKAQTLNDIDDHTFAAKILVKRHKSQK